MVTCLLTFLLCSIHIITAQNQCQNLSDDQCRIECEYYNNLELYQNYFTATLTNNWNISQLLSNTNITMNEVNETLLNYTYRWYTLSSYPYSFYGTENPDMCKFSMGTYCNIRLSGQMHGCCIPMHCNEDDAVQLISNNIPCYQSFLNYLDNNNPQIICKPMARIFNIRTLSFFVFVFILIFLCFVSSAKVYCNKDENQKHCLIVNAFCIQNNWKSLTFKRELKSNKFVIFDGIRSIVAYSVVWFHFQYQSTPNTINITAIFSFQTNLLWPKSLESDNVYTNGYTYFDGTLFGNLVNNLASMYVFFFMSGFFGSFSMIRLFTTKWSKDIYYDHKCKCNYFMYCGQILCIYIKRWLRLVPLLIFFMIFNLTINEQLSSGYNVTSRQHNNDCLQFGPSEIFMYNNFYNLWLYGEGKDRVVCVGGAWYVFNDFQCFLFLPFVIILFVHKKYIYGFVACFIPIIIGLICRIYYGYYYWYFDASTHRNVYRKGDSVAFREVHGYRMPMFWCSYYYIGVLLYMLIYYFENNKNHKFSNYKFSRIHFWILQSIGWGLMLIYLLLPWDSNKYYPNKNWSVYGQIWYWIAAAFSLVIGLSLFVISLIYKPNNSEYFSITYSFLSWSKFQIISKLTYCIYLGHTIFQRIRRDSMNVPINWTYHNYIMWSAVMIVYVTIFSLMVWLFFENPIAYMVDQLWKKYVIPLFPSKSKSKSLVEIDLLPSKTGSNLYGSTYETK